MDKKKWHNLTLLSHRKDEILSCARAKVQLDVIIMLDETSHVQRSVSHNQTPMWSLNKDNLMEVKSIMVSRG